MCFIGIDAIVAESLLSRLLLAKQLELKSPYFQTQIDLIKSFAPIFNPFEKLFSVELYWETIEKPQKIVYCLIENFNFFLEHANNLNIDSQFSFEIFLFIENKILWIDNFINEMAKLIEIKYFSLSVKMKFIFYLHLYGVLINKGLDNFSVFIFKRLKYLIDIELPTDNESTAIIDNESMAIDFVNLTNILLDKLIDLKKPSELDTNILSNIITRKKLLSNKKTYNLALYYLSASEKLLSSLPDELVSKSKNIKSLKNSISEKKIFVKSISAQSATQKNCCDNIHCAYKNNHKVCFNKLLKTNSPIDEKDSKGYTLLHLAAKDGNLEWLNLVINCRASINIRTKKTQLTPLHLAVLGQNLDCIKILLGRNADAYALNKHKKKPIDYVAQVSDKSKQDEILNIFITFNNTDNGESEDASSEISQIPLLNKKLETIDLKKYKLSLVNSPLELNSLSSISTVYFFILQLPQTVINLINVFFTYGFCIHLVGGALRDTLLGKAPNDYDFVTNASIFDIQLMFSDMYLVDVTWISSVRINIENITFDITSYYHPLISADIISNLYANSKLRDFNINALYWDPINSYLYDFHEGVKAVILQELIPVRKLDNMIKDDPSIIFRCLRFIAAGYSLGLQNDILLKAEVPMMEKLSIYRKNKLFKQLDEQVGVNKAKEILKIYGADIFHPAHEVYENLNYESSQYFPYQRIVPIITSLPNHQDNKLVSTIPGQSNSAQFLNTK